MRRTRIEHILSALPPLATEERTFGIGRRHVETERLRRLEVEGRFVLGWRLHRQVSSFGAARYRLPAVYYFRSFVVAGGLMSYGTDLIGQSRPISAAFSTGLGANSIASEGATDLAE